LLSEYIAGSSSAFVDMMNDKVEELGLENSHFENCTGLDDDVTNHYSCAYDLAVIATEVMKYDLIKDYSTVWLDSLRDGETELNNTNKLVNTYNGITGLKTGTTSNAGFCLCATATRDGMSLVSVVLGADTSEDRFNLSTQLLDYGFANYKISDIEFDNAQIGYVKVKNGVVKKITPVVGGENKMLVNKNSGDFEYEYKIKESVNAPINEGDVLGEVIVSSDNEQVATISLVSDMNVDKISFSYIFCEIIKNI
jgi:D-alanyl-D-alanine carboxypeptidase (penicillin-binding protein 5/6)